MSVCAPARHPDPLPALLEPAEGAKVERGEGRETDGERPQLARNRASVTNTMWPVTKMRPALVNIESMLCSVQRWRVPKIRRAAAPTHGPPCFMRCTR